MKYRVLRGGSYYIDSGYLRPTDRDRCLPEYRGRDYGFRVVVQRVKTQK